MDKTFIKQLWCKHKAKIISPKEQSIKKTPNQSSTPTKDSLIKPKMFVSGPWKTLKQAYYHSQSACNGSQTQQLKQDMWCFAWFAQRVSYNEIKYCDYP